MRPLKIGTTLDIFEGVDTDGRVTPAKRWHELRAIARRVEALGFDSLWVPDHLFWRGEGEAGPTKGVWEGWSILAALAAITERIELGTLVVCTAFRNPALLAKMADTVDEISGGRLILGLGAGYHEPEFRAFGYPFDHLRLPLRGGADHHHHAPARGADRLHRLVLSSAGLRAAPARTAPRRATDPGGRRHASGTADAAPGSRACRSVERLVGLGPLLARCRPTASAADG